VPTVQLSSKVQLDGEIVQAVGHVSVVVDCASTWKSSASTSSGKTSDAVGVFEN
jgi:hypothetical protein